MPTKTIIVAQRGHQQGVDRQEDTDLNYPGTRYNLHCLKPQDRGQSALGIRRQAWSEQVLTAGLHLSYLLMPVMTVSLTR